MTSNPLGGEWNSVIKLDGDTPRTFSVLKFVTPLKVLKLKMATTRIILVPLNLWKRIYLSGWVTLRYENSFWPHLLGKSTPVTFMRGAPVKLNFLTRFTSIRWKAKRHIVRSQEKAGNWGRVWRCSRDWSPDSMLLNILPLTPSTIT